MQSLTGKRRWLASRLIPIVAVLGGVYILDLEQWARDALLTCMAVPFIVTEALALFRGRVDSSDMNERAIDYLSDIWRDISAGRIGRAVRLFLGYTVAAAMGFFFTLLLKGKLPDLDAVLVFLKYYSVCMLLVSGFYFTVAGFRITGIRALSFHGMLWGLIGVCIVGYRNSADDPDHLVKTGLIALFTVSFVCVVTAGSALRSTEGGTLGILISMAVIVGLLFISLACLGDTTVTGALDMAGLSETGYWIALLGVATLGYATLLRGLVLSMESMALLGMLVFSAAYLVTFVLAQEFAADSVFERLLTFDLPGEYYAAGSAILVSASIFMVLILRWMGMGQSGIGYPLAACLIPLGFAAIIILAVPAISPLEFDASSGKIAIGFGSIFIGLVVTALIIKTMERIPRIALSLLLTVGTVLLMGPVVYEGLSG